MQRISTPSASSDHKFLPGNGGIFRGTQLSAAWCNAVQEEICNLLEDNGVTLNADNNAQLSALFSNLFAGHYAGQGHSQTMDIGYFGISIPTSEGYGIFIDSVNRKIELHLEDSDSKHTVIDSSGVTSEAALFDVLGVNGGIAIGRSGLSFSPTDNQNPALARVTFNGNLTIGGLNNERGLSLFGPMNMTGEMSVGGRLNAKIINNKHFIETDSATVVPLYTHVRHSDGENLADKDIVNVYNNGSEDVAVYIRQNAYVVIPSQCGGSFMLRVLTNSSGSVINKYYIPLYATEVTVS